MSSEPGDPPVTSAPVVVQADSSRTEPLGDSIEGTSTLQSTESGWGAWGGRWGLAGLSTKVQQAVVGAVRDVQELKESLQQALQEAKGDEEEEEGGGGGGGGEGEEVTNGTGRGEADIKTEEEEVKRQAVLARLEGKESQLETGLKAIDDQMEHLAVGAAKALGGLWGNLGKVVKAGQTLVQDWDASASGAQQAEARERGDKDQPIANLEGSANSPSAARGLHTPLNILGKLGSNLEVLGRSAFTYVAGEVAGDESKTAAQKRETLTFDQCFNIYGGRPILEDVEVLANGCARWCNRCRTSLDDTEKQKFDQCLSQLAPWFDLHQTVTAESEQLASEELQAMLLELHEPVEYLCQKSESLAGKWKRRKAMEVGSTEEQNPDSPRSGHNDGVGPDVGVSEALKVLAEIASAQLHVIFTWGCSMASRARKLDSTMSPMLGTVSLPWPDGSLPRVQVMRGQVEAMVQRLKAAGDLLTATFRLCSGKEGSVLEQATVRAVEVVEECYRHLLYIVLSDSLAQQLPDPEEETGESQSKGQDQEQESSEKQEDQEPGVQQQESMERGSGDEEVKTAGVGVHNEQDAPPEGEQE